MTERWHENFCDIDKWRHSRLEFLLILGCQILGVSCEAPPGTAATPCSLDPAWGPREPHTLTRNPYIPSVPSIFPPPSPSPAHTASCAGSESKPMKTQQQQPAKGCGAFSSLLLTFSSSAFAVSAAPERGTALRETLKKRLTRGARWSAHSALCRLLSLADHSGYPLKEHCKSAPSAGKVHNKAARRQQCLTDPVPISTVAQDKRSLTQSRSPGQ